MIAIERNYLEELLQHLLAQKRYLFLRVSASNKLWHFVTECNIRRREREKVFTLSNEALHSFFIAHFPPKIHPCSVTIMLFIATIYYALVLTFILRTCAYLSH